MHPEWAPWLVVLAGVAACRGGPGKADRPEPDSVTVTVTDADADTDVDSDTADTGLGPYAKAVRAYSITGTATVAGEVYDGLEVHTFENHVGHLCGVVYQASVVPSTAPPVADHGACAWGGTACTFSFDLRMHSPSADPLATDCQVFGLEPANQPTYQLAYGFVEDVLLSGTTPGGTAGYSYTADLMLVWTEPVGWYPLYDGLFASYFGLPQTTFDGGRLVYTAAFAEYY